MGRIPESDAAMESCFFIIAAEAAHCQLRDATDHVWTELFMANSGGKDAPEWIPGKML